MATKKKMNFAELFMKAAPKIFGLALLACTLFTVIMSYVMPSEGSELVADCEVFETQWYHVLENGKKYR